MLERASGELSLAQYRVLSSIAAGDERASRIAARLALGRPTISATVDSLSQRGLLTRSGVAGDQRAAALHLTPQGQALLDGVEAEMTNRLTSLTARTPDAHQLLESLRWLGVAIDGVLSERMAIGEQTQPRRDERSHEEPVSAAGAVGRRPARAPASGGEGGRL